MRLRQSLLAGLGASDDPRLQEVERELVGQRPVLRLVGEGVDRKLERFAGASVGGRQVANVTRLVVGDDHASRLVAVDAVVTTAEPVRTEGDGEVLLDRGRTRGIAL